MDESDNINDKLIDIELAKRVRKKTGVRKYLPAFVFAASFYYSFLFTLGLAVGYAGCKIFSKFLLEKGRIDCLYIDCGKWKIHLHHWIIGAVILLIAWIVDYFYLPTFFVGAICGIIVHDIYDFNDWHKVLAKNKEN